MKLQLSLLTLWMVWSVACGGPPVITEDGTRSDIPASGPEPGELEQTLRGHLDQLTVLIQTPNDDLQEVVFSIGRHLEFNREEIEDTIRLIAERIAAMTPSELAYYEERFAQYFTESSRRWFAALHAFRMEHSEAASRIDSVMLIFD